MRSGPSYVGLRKRDGRTIAYVYDALHRVASKSYPNGGARAVFYAYDMAGQVTAARLEVARFVCTGSRFG